MSSNVDERVTDEIEALEAILLDDVTVHSVNSIPTMIETIVHPSTGDDTDQQYVCVTLEVTLTPEYPDSSPSVKLRNPRGLDDSVIDAINAQVQRKLRDCLGQSVVFELIEVIRENLTKSNLPSGQCVICLYGFMAGDAFIKTPCYHHFHSFCLSNHLVAGEKNFQEEQDKLPTWQKQSANSYQPTCPVCRSVIMCDTGVLSTAPPPLELEAARQFELTADLRALQAGMAALFQRQRSRGGIIDAAADRTRLLLVTEEPALEENASQNSPSDDSPPEDVSSASNENVITKQNDNGSGSSSPQSNRGAYRGPFRGFNRNRGTGNRRGNHHQGRGRSVNGAASCASSTR